MNDKNDWEELIDRHLSGELDESDKERLAELLDSNTAARQEFVEHVRWDTEMAEALRESEHSLRDESSLAAEQSSTDGRRWSRPAFLRLLLAVAAVIILALSAGLAYQLGQFIFAGYLPVATTCYYLFSTYHRDCQSTGLRVLNPPSSMKR